MTFKYVFTFSLSLLMTTWLIGQSWTDTLRYINEDSAKLDLIKSEFSNQVYADPKGSFQVVDIFDSIALRIDNEKYYAKGNNLRGLSHYVNGEYIEAIDYFVDAISYFEKVNLPQETANVYNSLSTCYQVTGDNAKSISYSLKALDLFEELNDSIWIANVNSNLGLLYLNDEDLAEAERYLDIGITMLTALGKNVTLGVSMLNRGNLRFQQDRYDEAIDDFNTSMKLVPKEVVPIVHAAAKAGIGTVYSKSNKYREALKYLIESLSEAAAVNHSEQMMESNRELSLVYEALEDYEKSLKHERDYNFIKSEISEEEKDQRIVSIMAKYETAKKEQRISELNAENQVKTTKLKARSRQLIGLGIGAIMLIGFLLSVYRLNRKISDQNKVITKTLGEKDTLLREIHHRVKNNLQVISSLLALQSKYIRDDTAIDALQSGQDRVQSMALIHQDLYQADNLKGVDTELYLEQLIENLFETYRIDEEAIELHTTIDSVLLDVDTMIPMGLVVNELISNALKHAFEEGTPGVINVTFKDNGDQLFLQVSDNGAGLKDISVLKDKSFGYSLVESFAHKLGADIDLQSVDGLTVSLNITKFKRAD